MAELREEVDYTHQVLTKSAAEMEALINQIMKERVEDVSSLIDNARIHFRKSEFDKGMRLLKEAQKKLAKNFF